MTNTVTIDLVSKSPDGSYVLILVEEGPWEEAAQDQHLRLLQDRLYNSVDAFLQGVVAKHYPGSQGQIGIVRLNCFDLPKEPVQRLFRRLVSFVESSEEYDPASCGGYVSDLAFELRFGSVEAQ